MNDDSSMFGPYRLEALLGRGGMGDVYRAFDTEHRRMVALKRLAAHLADDDEYQQRFRREAHSAAQLRNPHVVPIHRYGEIDGQLYLDMRLVEGGDLTDLISSAAPMPPQRAVALLEQVASALDDAHGHQLVHRDVKPSNVLLDGQVTDFCYLADFGITRLATTKRSHTLTRSGAVIGSLAYMAPEQFDGVVSIQSDVYALSCVFFEMITGQKPYQGEGLAALMHSHMRVPPPKPSEIVATTTLFDDIVAIGMAKDIAVRYRTAGEFARAARAAVDAHRKQVTAVPPYAVASDSSGQLSTTVPSAPATDRPPAGVGATTRASHPPLQRHAWGRPAAVVAVLIAVIGGTWAVTQRITSSAEASNEPTPSALTTTSAAPSTLVSTAAPNGPVIPEAIYTGRTSDDISVAVGFKSGHAAGYFCDGKSVEAWLDGTVSGDQLNLHGKAVDNGLAATADFRSLHGTITIRGKQHPFSAEIATGSAGLYQNRRSVNGIATRIGWIVLQDGSVVGIRNQGGAITAAPQLDVTSLSAVDNGESVQADRVGGDTVVLGS